MQFVLYLSGRLSIKTSHLYEIFDARGFLNLRPEFIAECLIQGHEYHYENENGRVVDIFVISG